MGLQILETSGGCMVGGIFLLTGICKRCQQTTSPGFAASNSDDLERIIVVSEEQCGEVVLFLY